MTFWNVIERYEAKDEQERQDQSLILEQMGLVGDQILTRECETAHMTSSGVILNAQMNKMLMIHHKIYDTWAWTGGHADGEDDPLAVALKEAQEETGLMHFHPVAEAPASIEVLPVLGHQKNGHYISTHLHFNVSYVLIADDTEALEVNETETNGIKWVPIDEIGQYSNEPAMVEIYQKIIARGRLQQ